LPQRGSVPKTIILPRILRGFLPTSKVNCSIRFQSRVIKRKTYFASQRSQSIPSSPKPDRGDGGRGSSDQSASAAQRLRLVHRDCLGTNGGNRGLFYDMHWQRHCFSHRCQLEYIILRFRPLVLLADGCLHGVGTFSRSLRDGAIHR